MTDRQSLRILVVTQYFWPENMRINDLVEGMVGQGHQVSVLTGWPNYPEGKVFSAYRDRPQQFLAYAGADVVRVPLIPRGGSSIRLALNYLSFFISASLFGAWKLRRREFDVIFVYAVSPIMAAIPALLLGRLKRAPVLVWVLDLWPETLSAVGVVKNDRLLRLVGRGVSFIYNRTDYLLYQSHSFLESILRHCTKPVAPERLVYFPSWAEDEFSGEAGACDLLQADPGMFTVVFAGNVGESQDFPAILDAAAQLADAPVRWVIVGDGRMSDWVREQVAARKLDKVLLLGRHPLSKMPALFKAADALLVSLKADEAFTRTIPGKVQAYLAAGRPVLAMIDGEAARVVEESGGGMACRSGDATGLAAMVKSMAAMDESRRADMGRRGREYYRANFEKNELFARLRALMSIATRRGSNASHAD